MAWTYKLLRHLAHPKTDRMRVAVVEFHNSETGQKHTTPDDPSKPGCIFGDSISADYLDSIAPDIVQSLEIVKAGASSLDAIVGIERPVTRITVGAEEPK
jgi:hypothetical protein